MSKIEETQTFEQKVTSIVSELKSDDQGNLIIPEDLELDEATRFAVTTEKRRRDTQSAYSKAQQRVRQLESETSIAWQELENSLSVELTQEEQTELEELKTTNPELWRQKLNSYESRKKDKVKEKKTEAKTKTSKETELEERKRLVSEHNAANPDFQLTDDVIENDIPPRFTKELAEGKITFAEFVDKCSSFLQKGKVIDPGSKAPEGEVDLTKLSGSSTLPERVKEAVSSSDYKKEVY